MDGNVQATQPAMCPAAELRRARTLALVAAVFAATGCATPDHIHSTALPGAGLGSLRSFYVVQREDDERAIGSDIARVLHELGREARSGPADETPDGVDAVVTYLDRWIWGHSEPFCLQLTLYVRDTESGYIVGTGSAYWPELWEEKPVDQMAEEILLPLLVAPNAMAGGS